MFDFSLFARAAHACPVLLLGAAGDGLLLLAASRAGVAQIMPFGWTQCPVTPVPGVKETPRKTSRLPADFRVVNLSPEGAAGPPALNESVITTNLFGSAPWSPLPLIVDVIA